MNPLLVKLLRADVRATSILFLIHTLFGEGRGTYGAGASFGRLPRPGACELAARLDRRYARAAAVYRGRLRAVDERLSADLPLAPPAS